MSFIRYVEDAPKAKTKVWKVLAKDGGVPLGVIKWYAPWRQYSFFPYGETIFEKTCLGDLREFLVAQNRIHWERRRTKNESQS